MSNQLSARLRSRTGIGSVVALLVVLVVGGFWFFTDGPGWPIVSPRGATVATFAGDGDGETASFRVREGWRIDWSASGSAFAMTISGDQDMGTVVQVEGSESGVTAPPSKGTFHLVIRATGAWNIRILQGR